MNRNIDFLNNIYISHRGLHDEAKQIPENSIAAFKESINNNLAIELDIHILKDGSIVVFHDDNLQRLTGVNEEIKDCSYEDIKDLKLNNTEEKIPLFTDVLKLIDSQVLLIVEFKTDNKAGVLEEKASEILDNYTGKFIVKSFNPFSVLWFLKNRPQYIRGQLSCDFKDEKMNFIKKFILKSMFLNYFTKPDFISYGLNSLPNKSFEKVRKNNRPVLIWTIRSSSDLEKAKNYGDGFIFENTDIFKNK